MSVWVDVLCLFLLILLNGFFAMSEIAIVTARRSKLQAQAEAGSEKAKRALELAENPTRALSTIQVGITSIGILTGIVGESALVDPLAALLRDAAPITVPTSRAIAMVFVVILITYISIVVGELVPKRLGQLAADAVAKFVSGPVCWLSLVALPFVRLLSISTELIMKWLGVKPDSQTITEEEIHSMIEEGGETGVIDAAEHTMVRNVFRLDDRAIASLMVPRSEVEYIDLEDSREDNMRKILESRYSRLPVCVGGLDEVTGIVTTRQVLKQIATKGKPNFREISQPAVYVPESLSGLELMENFRKNDAAMALVVDEYGAVLGLVTPHDLLEAIAGEFKPDTPADANIVKISEDSYDLDGLLPIVELKDLLKAGEFPGEDEDRYSTAAGMLMYVLERIPAVGDSADIDGWTFRVRKMDGRRVDRITATRIPVKDEGPQAG